LADAIRRGDDGIEVELVEGGGGVFDVSVEGQLVYSKKQTGRFPEEGEVEKLIH